jgi:hypothetical protein
VLWVRVDPEHTWLRTVRTTQTPLAWEYQAEHERDVSAQIEVRPCLALSSASFCFVFCFDTLKWRFIRFSPVACATALSTLRTVTISFLLCVLFVRF